MYLKNCASVERACYTFQQWYQSGCTVLISPQDMNGILPSQHIRGNISVQGKVSRTTDGYLVAVSHRAAPVLYGDAPHLKPLENTTPRSRPDSNCYSPWTPRADWWKTCYRSSSATR